MIPAEHCPRCGAVLEHNQCGRSWCRGVGCGYIRTIDGSEYRHTPPRYVDLDSYFGGR